MSINTDFIYRHFLHVTVSFMSCTKSLDTQYASFSESNSLYISCKRQTCHPSTSMNLWHSILQVLWATILIDWRMTGLGLVGYKYKVNLTLKGSILYIWWLGTVYETDCIMKKVFENYNFFYQQSNRILTYTHLGVTSLYYKSFNLVIFALHLQSMITYTSVF